MREKVFSRFLALLVSGLVGGTILMGGFVAAVDPFGIIGLIDVSGFNAEKTYRLHQGGRVEHSVRLWRNSYETIILGTSRVQLGLNPDSETLRSLHGYNAGLSGTNMLEIYKTGCFVLSHQSPKRILFGLDFLTFNSHRTFGGDYTNSGFAGIPMSLVVARYLLDSSDVRMAFDTLRDNFEGKRAASSSRGYIDHYGSGKRKDYRRAFRGILEHDFLVNPETYGAYKYDPRRVELLGDLLNRATAKQVNLNLFINPIHARQQEAIAALGLYPIFEQWKRDVTALVARVEDNAPPAVSVTLWDFSGYNTVTTEEVPWQSDAPPMRWYWESSHYKAVVGDMIVNRMLHPERYHGPANFGVQLTTASIEPALATARINQIHYRETHPREVNDIKRLLVITAKKRSAAQRTVRAQEISMDVQDRENHGW
jgi:hypothetical protein